MSTTEVGVAYVRLLPSMEGFASEVKGELADALTRPARQAGEDAGKAMARGIEDGAASADVDGISSGIGDKLKVGLAAAGLGAGALLVEGLRSAMDLESTTKKLEAQLGNSGFAEDAGEVAGDLYKAGFGESVADTADAVRKIYQNGLLPDEFTTDEFERLATKAMTFTDVLGQDMDMTTQAIKSMLESGVAGSAEDAMDVMTRSIQLGADKAGDLAETFQEYSTSFRESGLTAADAAGLMVQGLGAGARDADKVADAVKEFGIRAQDGSKLSAEGFALVGLSAEEMTAKVAQGGPAARDALAQVLNGLRDIEDPATRSQAAVALFGTQAEDLGDALYALDLDSAATELGDYAGSTTELGSAYDNAAAKIESFKRGAMMELTEFIGGTVLPGIENLVGTLRDNLGPVFSEVKDHATEFWNALTSGHSEDEGTPLELIAIAIHDAWQELTDVYNRELRPALDDLIAKGREIVENIDWNKVWEELQPILSAAGGAFVSFATVAITAIGQIVENVASFITNVQELWREHETFRTIVSAAWDFVQTKVSAAFGIISGVFDLITALIQGDWSAAWDAAKRIVSNAWDSMTAEFQGVLSSFQGHLDGLKNAVSNDISAVAGFFTRLPGQIRSAFSTIAGAISGPFTSAFNSIRSLWNKTVGGFSFKVPDWIPGVGGKGFSIPKMHTGGIFDAPGGEGLALLRSGEGVFTPDQMAALGTGRSMVGAPTTVIIDAGNADQALAEWLRRAVRINGGGSVQLAFGQN